MTDIETDDEDIGAPTPKKKLSVINLELHEEIEELKKQLSDATVSEDGSTKEACAILRGLLDKSVVELDGLKVQLDTAEQRKRDLRAEIATITKIANETRKESVKMQEENTFLRNVITKLIE